MNRTGEKGNLQEEERSGRDKGATDKCGDEGLKVDTNGSYSELMKSLNTLSKLIKDEKTPSIEPQRQSSSIRSIPSRPSPSSSSSPLKKNSAANHVLMCDSLDSLVTHYITSYLSETAEDKLMKKDFENVRSYLKRKKNKKQEDMNRNEVNQPTARRFIMNGIRSSMISQASSGKIDGRNNDESECHKKLKLDQSQDSPLPEIRQVIKNPHDSEDEDEDDDNDELKIYDD